MSPELIVEMAPGSFAEVTIGVKAKQVGPLAHRASVVLGESGEVGLELITHAEVHAPFSLVAKTDSDLEVAPGQPLKYEFELLVRRSRSASNVQNSPGEYTLRIQNRTESVRWVDDWKLVHDSKDLLEWSRSFKIDLTAREVAGADGAEIVLEDGTGLKAVGFPRWKVKESIRSDPPVVLLGDSESFNQKLSLNAVNNQPFRILGVASNLKNISLGICPNNVPGRRPPGIFSPDFFG